MLILGLKLSEKILVGGNAVMLVSARKDFARLGFDFPQDVPVDREKVRDKIIAQGGKRRTAASQMTYDDPLAAAAVCKAQLQDIRRQLESCQETISRVSLETLRLGIDTVRGDISHLIDLCGDAETT